MLWKITMASFLILFLLAWSFIQPLHGITCTGPNPAANTLFTARFGYSLFTSGSRALKVLIGPTSGNLYLYGSVNNGTSNTLIRSVTTNNVEIWGKVYAVPPIPDGFAVDSTETYLYSIENSGSYARFLRVSTSDGSANVYQASGLMTNSDYLRISVVPGTNTIFFGVAYGAFTNGICKYTIGDANVVCAQNNNFNMPVNVLALGKISIFVNKELNS